MYSVAIFVQFVTPFLVFLLRCKSLWLFFIYNLYYFILVSYIFHFLLTNQQDKGNNGNKAKSMVESPSKGHKRRHGGGGGGTADASGAGTGAAGEVPGPDREQAGNGNGNDDERGPPHQKKKKNDTNSEV